MCHEKADPDSRCHCLNQTGLVILGREWNIEKLYLPKYLSSTTTEQLPVESQPKKRWHAESDFPRAWSCPISQPLSAMDDEYMSVTEPWQRLAALLCLL